MLRARKMGFITWKVRNQALKLFKFIENNDNPDGDRNGERAFLRSFFGIFPDGREIVIFDCGAHQGSWTACCLAEIGEKDPSLHLFEPSKSNYELLRQRFETNPRVKINSAGVSDTQGERTLYFDEKGSSLSSLYRRRVSKQTVLEKEEVVGLIRLEDYIVKEGIRHISLLKLDVEGHELAALSGMGKFLNPQMIDAIQFEYGGANVDSSSRLSDFYVLLEGAGFTLYKIMRTHIEPRKYSTSMENFMYSNYVALSQETIS
jgi:FkbM family methyltransferase